MTDPKSYFQRPKKAEAYKAYRRMQPDYITMKIIDFLSKTFDPSDCDAVDVGCGSGQATIPLASHLRHIVGIEVSQAQLDQIDKSSVPDNVHFQIGESDHLPFDDSSLHLINVKSALHWFDIPKFLQEVDRVLKPGGVLAVSKGGGFYEVVGHEGKARQLLREMAVTPAENANDHIRQLIHTNYKGVEFPYNEIIRDDSFYEEMMETVADVVRFGTWIGGFDILMEKEPDKAETLLKAAQEKFMKMLGLEGDPEETFTKIRYPYFLALCRKPLQE